MHKRFILLPLILCVGLNAWAGVANDIPSCYVASKVGVPVPSPAREIFVLVDQTTPLDSRLQGAVRETVGRLGQPGTAFVISSFSSFGQGRYLEILTAGTLEPPIDENLRNDIGVKLLRNFDTCLKSQLDYGRHVVAAGLHKALDGSSSELAKSDVMGSLREISVRVRQSSAKEKVVFIVSDMLENSGVSTFYANKNVRALDVEMEIKKAESAHQMGDFGGARIFVLGAGLVQESLGSRNRDSGVYRDPKTMTMLKQFWERYFVKSNARLVEFGAPALLSPVQ